ncbi:hypothetical protein GmHk_09G026067 [Glycine max]|nr:hypothetical protein GmHk_09G026067 [Glycine max]
MSVLELYIEKDVVGGSMFHSANSVTSCGHNLSHNELELPRNISNLHDDDDYFVSNSYVEESLDEDDSVNGISDTDDEVTNMIQPVTIVHPIEALVKSTYSRCRKYFVDRGRQDQRQLNEGQIYCSKVVKELQKNQEQAYSHIVRVYDIHSTRFEEEETFNPITQRGGQKWAVNLNDRYRQCGKYFALHYPCSHIIVACGYVSMNFLQYVDVVYRNEHILKAYSAQWWPLGNEAAIPPSDDAWTLIPDPNTIHAKGQPKSTRIRNEMDWLEPSEHRQKCSRCGAEGHNRRQCPMQSERGSCSFN